MNEHDLDRLLRQALSPAQVPSKALNQTTIDRIKERKTMSTSNHKRFLSVALAAALILALSLTAFASWRLLSARDAAEKATGNAALAAAFESEDAVAINKSIDSGDYHFTLHGIVTGEGLSGFASSSEDLQADRTYAVFSIAKRDGFAMPGPLDETYGDPPFFVSPLIKGQMPWQVNIASMNGGYAEIVSDGVLYRLIECDGIEMFADRGLYLCVSTSSFYDTNAFDYDESSGEVRANPSYNGACALFDLPLDASKADPKKADAYLDALLNPPEEPEPESQSDTDWEAELADGTVIPGSEKEVTYDELGMAHYNFDGAEVAIDPSMLFAEGQTGPSEFPHEFENDGKRIAVQFSRDENGVITAKSILLS